MDVLNVRTWIFFYLICFVALLWAVFLLAQGVMLWVGLTLVIIVVGFNFILITNELKSHKKRERMMKSISAGINTQNPDNKKGE
jgi:preprotein translocase subunit YajC